MPYSVRIGAAATLVIDSLSCGTFCAWLSFTIGGSGSVTLLAVTLSGVASGAWEWGSTESTFACSCSIAFLASWGECDDWDIYSVGVVPFVSFTSGVSAGVVRVHSLGGSCGGVGWVCVDDSGLNVTWLHVSGGTSGVGGARGNIPVSSVGSGGVNVSVVRIVWIHL